MQSTTYQVHPKVLRPLAQPRDVTVTITRKADGSWFTTMPASDLDYLIALEWQRQLRLPGFDPRNLRKNRKTGRSHTTRTNPSKR